MNGLGSFLKSLIAVLAISLTTSVAFAAENVIESVEISQHNTGYNLKIRTTEATQIKKRVENKNSAYFELKNVVPADDIDTIYNDVSDLDGVIIQQIDKSKIRIYVNGLGAAKTKATIEAPANIVKDTKEIIVGAPRSKYSPVNYDSLEESNWDDNEFTLANVINSTSEALNNMNIDFMLVLSVAVILISLAGLKKAFSNKVNSRDDVIGIKGANRVQDNLGAIPVPQSDLLKELKESEISTLNTNYTKPNAATQSYALNSYNKAQNKNPYVNNVRKGTTLNQPLRKVSSPMTPERPKYSAPKKNVASQYKNMQNLATTNAIKKHDTKANINMDNLKFLESVTQIYEKSGRKDLAQGIKSNLSKSKVAI